MFRLSEVKSNLFWAVRRAADVVQEHPYLTGACVVGSLLPMALALNLGELSELAAGLSESCGRVALRLSLEERCMEYLSYVRFCNSLRGLGNAFDFTGPIKMMGAGGEFLGVSDESPLEVACAAVKIVERCIPDIAAQCRQFIR